MRILKTVLLCFALTACGGGSSNETDEEQAKVFDPLIQSLDKAKAVEETVLQQKQDMDDAMKRMEEGDDQGDADQ